MRDFLHGLCSLMLVREGENAQCSPLNDESGMLVIPTLNCNAGSKPVTNPMRTLIFEYFATGEGYHKDVFVSDALDIESAYFETKNITEQGSKDWHSKGFKIFEGIKNDYVNVENLIKGNSNIRILFSYSFNNS